MKVAIQASFSMNLYCIGCPRIVRADRGTENAKVSFLHPFLRYQAGDDFTDNCFRYGKSVNNQVNM
jgi:hypothetical protein